MATDYASELLNAPARAAAAPVPQQGTDYASGLLNAPQAPQSPQAPSLSTLDLANRDTNKGTASFLTLSKASMVDDPQTKLKIFATSRFPKDPNAIQRYAMIDGEPVYVGDDGKVYKEQPGGFGGGATKFFANMAGNPVTTAGGIAGGIVGAPLGPVGVAGMSALGAAGGKGIDKVIANLALDEPQTVTGNLKSMGTEGAFAAGGSFIGSGFAKVLERGLARDIGKVSQPAVSDITRKAGAAGVDLDPAQITNLPSLKAKADYLLTNPQSRDIMVEGAEKRAGQASGAVDRFLASVSPKQGLDAAGEAGRDAAGKVISGIAKARSKAAAPLYKQAFEKLDQVGMQDQLAAAGWDLGGMMQRPAMINAAKKARQLAANEGIDLSEPQTSLVGMHYMKLALDDMIEPRLGAEGVGAVERRQFVNLKNQLLEVMDKMSPDYKKARETFAHFSPAVTDVRESVVQRMADLGREDLHKAADILFKGNYSPEAITHTADLFRKAGMSDQWNQLTRAYLENAWTMAGKETRTAGGAITQAPNWKTTLWGDPRQKAILEAALEPGQKAALSDLMDVFNAMSRTAYLGQGSQTAGRLEGRAAMERESGSGVVSIIAKGLSPQAWGTKASAWLDEVRLGNHAQKLAEIMTSPNAMQRLRELKQLTPGSKQFIQGASSLFGLQAAPAGVGADQDTSQGAAR